MMTQRTAALKILLCLSIFVIPAAVPSRPLYQAGGNVYRTVDYSQSTSHPKELMEIQDLDQQKRVLIETILPLVHKENEEIILQRAELLRIKKTSFYLTMNERRFIEDLAVHYKVSKSDYRTMLDELIVRVDVLPASLVLAQAAIESGWGTSRFALEGNNIFGIRNSRGMGMIPRERESEGSFALSTFDNLQSCIRFYLWNINTHPEYEHLRKIRTRGCFPYNPIELAQGLSTYSESGYAYVGKVVETIEHYNLQTFDRYVFKQDQAKNRLLTASSS
jgi:Bax protein